MTNNDEDKILVNGPEAKSVFRRLQHTLPFRLLIKGFLYSTKVMPVWLLRAIGRIFVFVFILFNPGNFMAIRWNLRKMLPELSYLACSYKAYEVFKYYSFYLIDLFYLSHDLGRLDEYSFAIEGSENLEKALSSGRGIILLTTHLGNWEIGGLKLAVKDRKVHVVYSPDSSAEIESQRSFVRYTEGIEEVRLEQGGFSSIKLLRILQDGGIVALQGDRLTFDSGIAVEFFGQQALFPKGPVKLAMASGSLILPAFVPITGYKSYRIIVEEPLIMERLDRASDELKTNLYKITKILEKNIGRYPAQWFTFMPFWDEDKRRH